MLHSAGQTKRAFSSTITCLNWWHI